MKKHPFAFISGFILLCLAYSGALLAQADGEAATNVIALGNEGIYSKSLAALTMLFVLAVLLESAFALIFNWRVFLTYFSLRGVRTIIMIVVSVIVVHQFNLDIVSSLINAYRDADQSIASGPLSKFITALILAGGSAGVHNIMHALGYRDSKRADVQPTPKDQTTAWIAVHVDRVNAEGEVHVQLREGAAATSSDPAPIAGTVGFETPRFIDLLLRNKNRFPSNGGYVIKPNVVYELSVRGKDGQGNAVYAWTDQNGNEEFKAFVCSPRAIVDFSVRL